MRRPALVWGALLLCRAGFVWGHSLVPGALSTGESDAVAEALAALLPPLGALDRDLHTLVIRKGAHVLEYAVLGILLCGLLRSLGRRRRLPVAALVLLVPFVDEGIQLHVPGRSGQLSDVLVDLVGMAAGSAVLLAIARLRRRGRAAGTP